MDYIYIVTKDTFEVKLIKRDEIKSFPNTIRQFLNLTEAYEFVSKELEYVYVVNKETFDITIIQGKEMWSIKTPAFWSPDLKETREFVIKNKFIVKDTLRRIQL